jgi:hypothetical protein
MIEDLRIILSELNNDIKDDLITLKVTSLHPTTRQEVLNKVKRLQKYRAIMRFTIDKYENVSKGLGFFN